ncbi:multidrug transporter [Flaviaesturariibacter flavus]|uniref:Multidrug transporter n=1 Tax=Flaviaesturariibacter flavus TaxID=2502780 RepID=A0A4R1B8W6_9BACT|nr:multidrug transporter [Flaviaesturariibacter flavus]TCJ13385.1 multidrug transporter [Flaviaesturariibacter flavus]
MDQPVYVRATRVTKALFLILFVLIAANLFVEFRQPPGAGDVRGWQRIFSLDGERNVPTAFNVFLLLFDAALLLLITRQVARGKRLKGLPWLILTVGFVVMAMDEAWTLHEELIGPIRQRLGNKHLGVFYNAWIIPGIAVALLVGLSYIRFLAALPQRTRIGFIVSGIVYLSGALGMEALDGYYLETHGKNFYYSLSTMLEEGLEMSGLILFSYYLLDYISQHYGTISFTFTRGAFQRILSPRISPESRPVNGGTSVTPPLLPVAGRKDLNQKRQ